MSPCTWIQSSSHSLSCGKEDQGLQKYLSHPPRAPLCWQDELDSLRGSCQHPRRCWSHSLLTGHKTMQGPPAPGQRGGKSPAGNPWEQGSCNRNIGTSILREAGGAGRRRNLSRKRAFASDTSRNKTSPCQRNVLNAGSSALLCPTTLSNPSQKSDDPSVWSPLKQKEVQVPAGSSPK